MKDQDQKQYVKTHLFESAYVIEQTFEFCTDQIVEAAQAISDSFKSGGKLLLCGNGGSAADCQHMAAEFVNYLTKDFQRDGFPVIALTTDTSFITSFSNDCGFEGVFERQVKTLGKNCDILIGISTSGNSNNIIKAVKTAQKLGIKTIVLSGSQGSLNDIGDIVIAVPSDNTQYIQQAHLSIEHLLCALVEKLYFTS